MSTTWSNSLVLLRCRKNIRPKPCVQRSALAAQTWANRLSVKTKNLCIKGLREYSNLPLERTPYPKNYVHVHSFREHAIIDAAIVETHLTQVGTLNQSGKICQSCTWSISPILFVDASWKLPKIWHQRCKRVVCNVRSRSSYRSEQGGLPSIGQALQPIQSRLTKSYMYQLLYTPRKSSSMSPSSVNHQIHQYEFWKWRNPVFCLSPLNSLGMVAMPIRSGRR